MPQADMWWRDAVFYQVYVRSFADADGDGVGDLRGLTGQLDYLRGADGEGLGVDALWLSPIFPSPMADFGYDISNYLEIDRVFGSIDDFDRFLEEAHRRELRVILDWVPNHSSDQHPWFQQSRKSRRSPYRDWYVWRDPAPDGGPPNNWLSTFPSVGGMWTFDQETGQYYLHSFLPQQPDLNWENPQLRAAMHDVIRFWLDRGVDGLRIDVAHKLGKDPALGDNPFLIVKPDPQFTRLRHDEDWEPNISDRLRELHEVVHERPGRMTVGEVYILDQSRLVEYLHGDGLDLVHNFMLMRTPWTLEAVRDVLEEWERLSGGEAWPTWFFGNHDHSRIATRFAENGDLSVGLRRARAAALLLLTARGTPFIFQGEELGLPDVPVPVDQIVDVDGRDGCRTPLPWQPASVAGPGAGFTAGVPWLPVGDLDDELSIARQVDDPTSMLSLYTSLLRLRRAHPALREGSIRFVDVTPTILAYERIAGDDKAVVMINFDSSPVALPAGAAEAGLVLKASTNPERTATASLPSELAPDEGVILVRAEQSAGVDRTT